MKPRTILPVQTTKNSAQSIILDLAELRFELHKRIFWEEEYNDSEDIEVSAYEKFGTRTTRQRLRSCVDLFKDFCDKYTVITTNPEYIAISNEKPWIRMVRYASCEDETFEGRQHFWYIIDYAIQTYMNYLEVIR